MSVFIIQKIFPEYRKPVFDAIYDKVPFKLLHSKNKSGIKQTAAGYSFKVKKIQYGKGDTSLFLFVFGQIIKYKPKIIIHELAVGIVSLPLVLLFRKIFGYKLILWGHVYNRRNGFNPQKHFSDKYRLWLHKKADAIITYSNDEKNILINNKIDSAKIFPALNTLGTHLYIPIRNELEKVGKIQVKKELGFGHEFNLIYIGRLLEDKLPDYLITILELLKKKNNHLSVAVHFVGTGNMENLLKQQMVKSGLQNDVFFHGEVYNEDITGKLLFASNIMVMPGYVGLSVNHAFCFDCPVITFESKNNVPAHSPEIEYIINNKTGFIAKHNNVEAMANIIEHYLSDLNLQLEMKQEIRNMIENVCPIEKLVEGFDNAIRFCINE